MAQIKAAEVSAILKKQLANFDESVSLEEVGTVLEVGDGIRRPRRGGIIRFFYSNKRRRYCKTN